MQSRYLFAYNATTQDGEEFFTILEKFINNHRGNSVWFATQAGIFQRTLSRDDLEREKDILILDDAFYFTGNIRLTIGCATIIRNHIIGWGTSNPAHRNSFV